MKKIIALIATVTLTLSLVPSMSAGAADYITNNVDGNPFVIYLDGTPIPFRYQPVAVNDVLYVPLYEFLKAVPLDFNILFDDSAMTVSVAARGLYLIMTVGSDAAKYNFVNSTMPAPLRIMADTIFVPLDYISSVFGYNFDWDRSTNAAFLTNTHCFIEVDWNDAYIYAGYYSPTGYGHGILYNKATDKAEYYGHFENGAIVEGAYFADNGDHFIGDLSGNGYGELYWADGDYYTGEFKNGVKDGQGEYHWSTGDYYVGEFKNDKCEGQGALYCADGMYYIGSFKNNLRSGYGQVNWPNGDSYAGEWENDARNGYGTYNFASVGYALTGYWADSQYIGQ